MKMNRNNPDVEEQHNLMMTAPTHKLVFTLAIPTIASQLVSVFYNTVDVFFVSKISTSASAAVGVNFALMSIIHAVGYGVGMGANSIISRCLGRKENRRADCYASSAFVAALLIGLLIMVAGLITLEPLMMLLGATDTILPYSCSYARIILIGSPIMCSAFVLNNVLRAEGDAKLSMWGLCIGSFANIALDPIFIFCFDMGIAGAALATVLSQAISFSILLSAFIRRRSIVQLKIKNVSHMAAEYWKIFVTGLPTIFRQGCASIASACLNNAASVYGDSALAAITIANKIYMFVRSVIIGVGQGFQPVAGYNYGAGNKKRTKEAFRFSVVLGSTICSLAAVVIFFFGARIIIWFRNDPDVVSIGKQALQYACVAMPIMAYSTYVNQLYQCLGFYKTATFLASCRQGIVFLPLVFLLPRHFGIAGVEMVQPLADIITFVVSIFFQVQFFKTKLDNQIKTRGH